MSGGGRRRFALFARSRRTPLALALLVGCGVATGLLLARAERPESILALAATLPLGWAAVVGLGVASPFGDAERAAAYPLPRLRLAHLVGLVSAGALTLLAGSLPGDGAGWLGCCGTGPGLLGWRGWRPGWSAPITPGRRPCWRCWSAPWPGRGACRGRHGGGGRWRPGSDGGRRWWRLGCSWSGLRSWSLGGRGRRRSMSNRAGRGGADAG